MDLSFDGAKVALFLGDNLLTKLRDDRDDIPFPNQWDFPGGGREGQETPQQTALRETFEEFHVRLVESDLIWAKRYKAAVIPNAHIWFFVAHLPASRAADVILGNEGQAWRMMSVKDFMDHPQAIAHFKSQLQEYLDTN